MNSAKSPRSRRASTGSEVLCATAGADNWKTWAGRSHGSDRFEFLDLFRGVKRKFNVKFVWGIPLDGTACPVCLMVPDSKQDWHVTSACGHATCKDCLHGYASSLVRDPSHQGPLKCPVCPLPLRPKDAISALASDPELMNLWDAKIRDGVLRALPGYRHCPRCSSGAATSTNNSTTNTNTTQQTEHTLGDTSASRTLNSSPLMGGGFVTPECLAPIHKQRESIALAWIHHPFLSERFFVGLYFVYVYVYCGALHSTSVFVDLVHITVIPMWCLWRLWNLTRHVVAVEARRTLLQPITVECPCCDEAFLLNASAELGNSAIADKATEAWIGNHTRPCPSCSVPISKIDGCNHMQCAHCRANFCWACMRVGSSCNAFHCRNGAPYGNAGDDSDDNDRGARDELGILDRIDRMEQSSVSTWNPRRDGFVMGGIVLSFVTRENATVQWAAETIIKSFAFLCTSGTFFASILGFVLYSMSVILLDRRLQVRDLLDGNAAGGVVEELFDVDNTVERRMIRDAIRRSMVER